MKIAQIVKRVLYRGCAFASPITLLMFFFMSLTGEWESLAIPFSQFALIFLFSFFVGTAHEIFFIRKLPIFVRILIHYAALLFTFIILFIVSGKIAFSASKIFVYIVIFTILYAVICGLSFLLMVVTGYYEKNLLKQESKKGEKKPYTKRYS